MSVIVLVENKVCVLVENQNPNLAGAGLVKADRTVFKAKINTEGRSPSTSSKQLGG
jgi:hypothetical protein